MSGALDDPTHPPYLVRAGLLADARGAVVEPAGDGNINWVRRVRAANGRSLVVKQARAALERFPEYKVDSARMVFEARYFEQVRARVPARAGVAPQVLWFDEPGRVLVMEDLGDAARLDTLLADGRAEPATLEALGAFLGDVHRATRADAESLAPRFANDEMRALHGEHIFSLPYQPNDFPIEPRLRALADELLARPGLRPRIAELRARYYAAREALVHGDVQPGNVLVQGVRPRLLDAEIAHVGDPAFDLGQAFAHVHVQRVQARDADPLAACERALFAGYSQTAGRDPELEARARAYAGVEILRRSIGAARLSLLGTTARAERALELGAALLAS
ncbi:MAG: phosphotransferase [Myxococcota bacterium]